jgi:polar amino acid transport system substrate-binding protein
MPASHLGRPSPGIAAVVVVSLVLGGLVAGCSGGGGTAEPTSAPSGDPTKDKLAQVLARGTLVLSTDLEYAPQSYGVEGAARAADTRCTPDQLTADEVAGYDADTGKVVAAALGVEPCFVIPPWTEITAGNWGDRWDISYGSGSINADRMTRLWMTQPYYAVPNRYFVRADSPYQAPADLDGEEIGACASCSHEYYLNGELEIPGVEVVLNVEDPVVVTFQTETTGLEALAQGDLDAFLCADPVGGQAIADGLDLRSLDEPAFTYYPSGFVDKSSGLDATAFVEQVNEIIRGLHADGTLKALSMEYFGADYAAPAAEFDLDAIGQTLE